MGKKKRNWNSCTFCSRLKHCLSGQERLKNIPYDSPVLGDIGCFNSEIYLAQIRDKQLGLFRPSSERLF